MEISADTPFVSVIIPAYNNASSLYICLESLQKQTYPASRREIIVVDNASSPPLKNVVASFEGVIYESEPAVGSYAARNRGIHCARGEILAFIDADCCAAPDWLQNGVHALRNSLNCGLVGGRIALTFREPLAPGVWEICDWLYMGFKQRIYLAENHFAATANALTFAAIFEEIGVFDASLLSGGDFEWGNRVFGAGYAQNYAENAVVTHGARASRSEMLRKIRRLQGGHLAQERRHISYRRFVARCLIRLARAPRSFRWEREKLALLENYRALNGTSVHFSRSFQAKIVFARWQMLFAAQMEMLRILLGGKARRE